MFKTLCLSGGGITGFVHVGILETICEQSLHKHVDTVIGSSIGAVVGCLFSVGISPKEIYDIFVKLDERKVIKYKHLNNFFESYGVDSGEYFMAFLIDIFVRRGIKPTITFAQLLKTYKKRLICTGSNLFTHKTDYFGPETTPELRVLDALRISISIPFLFSAMEYEETLYCDGGITNNFPIQFAVYDFKRRYPSENPTLNVLGCNIESLPPRPVLSIEDYIYNIFACTIKKDNQDNERFPNIISINLNKMVPADISANYEQRVEMYCLGKQSAKTFLLKFNELHKSSISRRRSH